MTDGSDGITTRKLVRQEWKPLGGKRITLFVAVPGSDTVPSMQWEDDLPGSSEVLNEVIGQAEMTKGIHSKATEDIEEFRAWLDDVAVYVNWLDDWDPDEEEDDVDKDAGLAALFDGGGT